LLWCAGDSTISDTIVNEAWIEVRGLSRTWSKMTQCKQCRIFFGNSPEPVLYELYTDDNLADADFLPVSNELKIIQWHFDQSPDKLKLSFKGSMSPDFYGIAFDGEGGVAVDNIPMRGSAGLVFTKIDQNLLKQMFDSLNVKMLILQFGGNVVPYIAENYSYYEKWFTGQLKSLKQLCPDITILVVGVSDMSVKEKDRFVTYPYLEEIRDALKTASFNAGCAYWDMFEAMGGRNSMPSWVFAEPSLATSDFVHFNERGARVIAEMFYNAFIFEYESYLDRILP
jgi:lysophospholipase L1-like esterase